MKRDMDLIRRILIEVESGEESEGDAQYSKAVIGEHVQLLKERGLIEASILPGPGGSVMNWRILRMTWAGHDFLESVRDDERWARTKRTIVDKGGAFTLEIVKGVAIGLARQQLGLPPG